MSIPILNSIPKYFALPNLSHDILIHFSILFHVSSCLAFFTHLYMVMLIYTFKTLVSRYKSGMKEKKSQLLNKMSGELFWPSHYTFNATILTCKYLIPSDLRSQTCSGLVSIALGDHARTLGVAFFFNVLLYFITLKKSCLFFRFYLLFFHKMMCSSWSS